MQNTTKEIKRLIENTLKDKNEFGALLRQLTPLINKYARHLFKDEPEEVRAEMALALWEAVLKMKYFNNDGECLVFLSRALRNRFRELCRKSKSQQDFHLLGITEEILEQEDSKNRYDEMILKEDIKKLLSNYSEKKRQILNDIIFEDKSDAYIAKKYALSRQYVNRLRKEFLGELKEKYFMNP